jgi:hypothetical protein
MVIVVPDINQTKPPSARVHIMAISDLYSNLSEESRRQLGDLAKEITKFIPEAKRRGSRRAG